MAKRGKLRRCSHVNRQTGERCTRKLKAPKSQLRIFCKKHKRNHHPKNKTEIIVRRNNRIIQRDRKKSKDDNAK